MPKYVVLAEGISYGPGGEKYVKRGKTIDGSELSADAIKWLLADGEIKLQGKEPAPKPSAKGAK